MPARAPAAPLPPPPAPPTAERDQFAAVARVLAAGLARLRLDALCESPDFETNELAVSPHKSVTVPGA